MAGTGTRGSGPRDSVSQFQPFAYYYLLLSYERELCRNGGCVVHVGYGKLDDCEVLVLTLDVTDTASHAAATDAVINHFGRVTIAFLLLF